MRAAGSGDSLDRLDRRSISPVQMPSFSTSPIHAGQPISAADELTLREASAAHGHAHIEWVPNDEEPDADAHDAPQYLPLSPADADGTTAASIMRRTVEELKALCSIYHQMFEATEHIRLNHHHSDEVREWESNPPCPRCPVAPVAPLPRCPVAPRPLC